MTPSSSASALTDMAAAIAVFAGGQFLVPVALRGGADSTTFTFVRRFGDLLTAVVFMWLGNGSSAFNGIAGKFGPRPALVLVCALVSGFANTGGSLLVQRAQGRGMDPGTTTSFAALYPAITTLLCVLSGYEKLTSKKLVGMALAIGSGLCFATSK